MRKPITPAHPISIYSVSRDFLPDHPRSEMTEASVTIENGVIKKNHPDRITVNAVAIREAPGQLIFVLEPTHREFLRTNFALSESSELRIFHKGNIFASTAISFADSPAHPIIHTEFLKKDPDHKVPLRGYDAKGNLYWEKRACLSPEQYAGRFFDSTLKKIRDLNGYTEMILEDPTIPKELIHERPVTAKLFDTFTDNGELFEEYVLLEGSSYFSRVGFTVKKGCILRDDLKALECLAVYYPTFPYHPVLITVPLRQENIA